MKILVIGDIFGKPGRNAVKELLPQIIKNNNIDFVIANVENASGGRGLTPKTADEILKFPIDVMTGGNHIWEHKGLYQYFDKFNIIRPINTKNVCSGRGYIIVKKNAVNIAVIAAQGTVYMGEKGEPVVNPFTYFEKYLDEIREQSDIVIVDFHAEATSEKRAMGWFLDGKVLAIVGTHTHVQTSDEEILPQGTAYISDIGMTGPHASVIGMRKQEALQRFLLDKKKSFKVATNDIRLEGVIVEIDKNLKPIKIERVREYLCPNE